MHYSLCGHGYSPVNFFFVQGCHVPVFWHQSGATVSAFQSVETLRYTTAGIYVPLYKHTIVGSLYWGYIIAT